MNILPISHRQLFFTLGLAAAVVAATPEPASAQGRFNGLDRNRDGVVTRAEWRGNDRSFRNQDRNRDGVLSGAELNQGSTAIVPIWWGYDRDNDGRVSRSEWPGIGIDFDGLDRNDDGWLSRDEVNQARTARRRDRSVGTSDADRDDANVKSAKPYKGKPAKKLKKAKKVKPGKPGNGRG